MTSGAAAVSTLFAGFVGGLVFSLIGFPLPWTLGAMAAVGMLTVLGRKTTVPPLVGEIVRPVVGVLAGSAFTSDAVALLASWWPVFIAIAAFSILATAAGYVFFRSVGGLDRSTAFFASAPGGLGEISLLGASLGANIRSLVLVHSIRIIAVIVAVPVAIQFILGPIALGSGGASAAVPSSTAFDWMLLVLCGIAGYGVGKLLNFPGGVMIPAMLFSAVLHGFGITHASPPTWTLIVVQIVIGSMAGARFSGVTWAALGSVITLGVAWAAVLLVLTFGSAFALATAFQQPFVTLLLALAPGGMVEMTVVVYALGIDVTVVIACQVFRIFTILTLMPLFSRFFAKPPGDEP